MAATARCPRSARRRTSRCPRAARRIRWGPFEVKGSGDLFKVDWTTPGHSATPVPVTASGPGAERLTGIYNNTYIHEVAYDVLHEGMP